MYIRKGQYDELVTCTMFFMAIRGKWHLELIYDAVLIRSVLDYREALAILEADDACPKDAEHVQAMREELTQLEEELRERGIDPSELPRRGR